MQVCISPIIFNTLLILEKFNYIFLALTGNKRKLNVEGEYDPSSPTSETNDETPAKKVALSNEVDTEDKQEIKPASPKKKTLPELEKYWKAVNEDPCDFTGWTYLLQYVDQEVRSRITLRFFYCIIQLLYTFTDHIDIS